VTKDRIPIPKEIAADVLIAHYRTCCVCQERGKRVQIHHIDDDPSNNDPSNLAVLCLDCHDETQIRGGFARSLDADQVMKFRDEWVKRVAETKKKADEILLQKQVGIIATATNTGAWRQSGLLEMTVYLESIPDTMQKAYNFAQAEWNKGNTASVTQATYQVTALAERLWIGLSTWYRPNHFNDSDAEKYVSEYITERYNLRHALMEPEGPGTGGSMMRPMIAYGVLLDVQQLIVLIVRMMVGFSELATKINLDEWEKRFSDATNSYSQ
jgi:hypothetical protein